MSTYQERLALAMAESALYKTPTELANAIGCTSQAISSAMSGATKQLGATNHSKAAALLGVIPTWLASGEGPMRPIIRSGAVGEAGLPSPQLIDMSEHPDLVPVRRVQFKLAAGVQGYAIEPLTGDGVPIFFRQDWLKTRGFRAEKLVAIKVCGASMEPGLYDGDLVVVNTADTTPADGEVFAVNYEGEMGVKRLQRDAGEWWLTSDNGDQRRYGRKRCNGDVQLIGRVIYKQSERL